MTNDAFERVVYNGRLMDKKTRAFVQAMEEKLGYSLTITQGCYNKGGVAASAGTHDLGGVLDLPSNDRDNKLRVLKDLGGFGWYRPAIAGLWGPHIHFGIINHGNMSSGAVNQQRLYLAGRSGLASNAIDSSYRARPTPVFKYRPTKVPTVPPPTNVSRARDELVERLHAGREALALLSNAPKNRKVVWAKIEELRASIKTDEAILDGLPKR